MKRILLILCLLLPLVPLRAEEEVRIVVKNQADFDRLPASIDQALKKGVSPVTVDIRKGTYYFQENHLLIQNYSLPRMRFTIRCNGALFLPAGPDYKLKASQSRRYSAAVKGPFDYKAGYVDLGKKRSLDLRGPVKEALGRPEILDQEKGLCRIRVNEPNLGPSAVSGVYILLSQWYRGRVYPVEKIESGYLYFRSDKVTSDRNALTDPDADYKVQQRYPHYILYNHPEGETGIYMTRDEIVSARSLSVHQGEVSNFMTVKDCVLGTFSLEGARFLTNRAEDCLLGFSNVQATELAVRDCSFDGIRSDVLHVSRSTNLLVCGNLFTRTYRKCITLDAFTAGAEIRDNRFSDTGYMMNNDFCIESQASNLWVHGNVFQDFSYGAVGVGTYYKQTIPASSTALIENNEMFCTPAFLKHPARLLMDSGAIYTWTINKEAVIKDNYIHDIGGYGWNRGIFCDDGSINVKVIGNRVERIDGDYCIYLRLALSVETDPGSQVKRANVGNKIEGNRVDGPVLFVNREDE